MKEIFESIFVGFKERFQNRFIGTFIVVFLILNWKRDLALFFLDDLKYEKAIGVLSMDERYFYCLMARSVLYSLIYLIVSPWLSYLIQRIQSIPINLYKRKAISDNMKVLVEKEILEKKKKQVAELEHKNLIAEESRSDEIIFDRLKSSYSEQSLIRLFDALRDKKGFSPDGVQQLKAYIVECDVVDHVFSNKELESKKIESAEKLKKIYGFIVANSFPAQGTQNWLNLNSDLDDEINEMSADALKFYRIFRSHKFTK